MSSTLRSSSDFGDARDVAMPRCSAVILVMLTLSESAGRDDAYASVLTK